MAGSDLQGARGCRGKTRRALATAEGHGSRISSEWGLPAPQERRPCPATEDAGERHRRNERRIRPLETVALDRVQEEKVIARFRADRDEQYREFLGRCTGFEAEIAKEIATKKFTYAELEEEDTDLKKLQGWLEKIRKLDFYGAALAGEAAERLRACEVLLDGYAQRVFDAHDENR